MEVAVILSHSMIVLKNSKAQLRINSKTILVISKFKNWSFKLMIHNKWVIKKCRILNFWDIKRTSTSMKCLLLICHRKSSKKTIREPLTKEELEVAMMDNWLSSLMTKISQWMTTQWTTFNSTIHALSPKIQTPISTNSSKTIAM